MLHTYAEVTTRFLRNEERLILSEEREMPLVIEAQDQNDLAFLQQFLASHSSQILSDISTYGAVLLRGFEVASEHDFEKTVLSLDGFQGISEAFMSEEGRVPVGDLKFVLHTNAVYKTGGTVYLGGFHSENYYSPDVPSYICFFCQKPSLRGGETGLINMQKIYALLDDALKAQLEKRSFFVTKWLVSDVAKRYNVSTKAIAKMAKDVDLPIMGKGKNAFIMMYKPNVFEHPVNGKKSLQINLFELLTLNVILRKRFMADYSGKDWFWHRFVWKMPASLLKVIERVYIAFASFFYSPKESFYIFLSKCHGYRASRELRKLHPELDLTKVGDCFSDQAVESLATQMRNYYSSCLWQAGDILLVDNRKVMHAGMPGAGPRLLRAMIGNPMDMGYSREAPAVINCKTRIGDSIGSLLLDKKTANVKIC